MSSSSSYSQFNSRGYSLTLNPPAPPAARGKAVANIRASSNSGNGQRHSPIANRQHQPQKVKGLSNQRFLEVYRSLEKRGESVEQRSWANMMNIEFPGVFSTNFIQAVNVDKKFCRSFNVCDAFEGQLQSASTTAGQQGSQLKRWMIHDDLSRRGYEYEGMPSSGGRDSCEEESSSNDIEDYLTNRDINSHVGSGSEEDPSWESSSTTKQPFEFTFQTFDKRQHEAKMKTAGLLHPSKLSHMQKYEVQDTRQQNDLDTQGISPKKFFQAMTGGGGKDRQTRAYLKKKQMKMIVAQHWEGGEETKDSKGCLWEPMKSKTGVSLFSSVNTETDITTVLLPFFSASLGPSGFSPFPPPPSSSSSQHKSATPTVTTAPLHKLLKQEQQPAPTFLMNSYLQHGLMYASDEGDADCWEDADNGEGDDQQLDFEGTKIYNYLINGDEDQLLHKVENNAEKVTTVKRSYGAVGTPIRKMSQRQFERRQEEAAGVAAVTVDEADFENSMVEEAEADEIDVNQQEMLALFEAIKQQQQQKQPIDKKKKKKKGKKAQQIYQQQQQSKQKAQSAAAAAAAKQRTDEVISALAIGVETTATGAEVVASPPASEHLPDSAAATVAVDEDMSPQEIDERESKMHFLDAELKGYLSTAVTFLTSSTTDDQQPPWQTARKIAQSFGLRTSSHPSSECIEGCTCALNSIDLMRRIMRDYLMPLLMAKGLLSLTDLYLLRPVLGIPATPRVKVIQKIVRKTIGVLLEITRKKSVNENEEKKRKAKQQMQQKKQAARIAEGYLPHIVEEQQQKKEKIMEILSLQQFYQGFFCQAVAYQVGVDPLDRVWMLRDVSGVNRGPFSAIQVDSCKESLRNCKLAFAKTQPLYWIQYTDLNKYSKLYANRLKDLCERQPFRDLQRVQQQEQQEDVLNAIATDKESQQSGVEGYQVKSAAEVREREALREKKKNDNYEQVLISQLSSLGKLFEKAIKQREVTNEKILAESIEQSMAGVAKFNDQMQIAFEELQNEISKQIGENTSSSSSSSSEATTQQVNTKVEENIVEESKQESLVQKSKGSSKEKTGKKNKKS